MLEIEIQLWSEDRSSQLAGSLGLFTIGRLEPVQRTCVMLTTNVNNMVFLFSLENCKWPIIWLL